MPLTPSGSAGTSVRVPIDRTTVVTVDLRNPKAFHRQGSEEVIR